MFSTTQTLEFAYVLNAGTVYKGAPFSDFSIFEPLHAFFGFFKYKIRIFDPNLVHGGLFEVVTQ